ncbi:MAG TPA: hypothetical protein VGB94_02125 [Acidobacteriaceae bacterium]
MRNRTIAVLAISLGFALSGPAQVPKQPAAQAPAPLTLSIQLEDMQAGVPQTISFTLANSTDRDLLVPTPVIDCGRGYDGVIRVKAHFTPLNPKSPDDGYGHGCTSEEKSPPIMDRIKSWTVLHPGKSISIRKPLTKYMLGSASAGTYEVWADYSPPHISLQDRETLQQAGIYFSCSNLESAHLSFIRNTTE